MPDRERTGVPEHRSNVLKGSLPQGPSAHPRNAAESEKGSRDEATQKDMEELYQKQYGSRYSYFVLNPAADW